MPSEIQAAIERVLSVFVEQVLAKAHNFINADRAVMVAVASAMNEAIAADHAAERAGEDVWTQEQLDRAKARADRLSAWLNPERTPPVDPQRLREAAGGGG